jgi:copper(I)-binding protein
VRYKFGFVVPLLFTFLLGAASSTGASTVESIGIKHVTVTAAKKGHPAAVCFTLTNKSGSTIWVTSVSSPLSPTDMIDYDANMMVSSSHMVATPSVKVRVGHSIVFSLRGQGAMLGSISKTLRVGTLIPLSLGWHSKTQPLPSHFTFSALVVKARKKIYFGRSSDGSMPGMNMG